MMKITHRYISIEIFHHPHDNHVFKYSLHHQMFCLFICFSLFDIIVYVMLCIVCVRILEESSQENLESQLFLLTTLFPVSLCSFPVRCNGVLTEVLHILTTPFPGLINFFFINTFTNTKLAYNLSGNWHSGE